MTLWPEIVELFHAGIFTVAQALGGNVGAGIVCFSILVRLALLPLTYRLARRSLAHRAVVRQLQPELERLRKRFRHKPEKLAAATLKLFERHGARPVDSGGLLGAVVQMPVVLAMYSAVRKSLAAGGRFFWISDIARPDALLTLLVSLLTYLAVRWQPELPEQGRTLVVMLPVVLSALFLWRTAAGLGLYWGASTLVGAAQTVLLRRHRLTATK